MRIKIVLYWIILIIVLFNCIGCSKDEDTDLVVDKTAVFISNLDGSEKIKVKDVDGINFNQPLWLQVNLFIEVNINCSL